MHKGRPAQRGRDNPSRIHLMTFSLCLWLGHLQHQLLLATVGEENKGEPEQWCEGMGLLVGKKAWSISVRCRPLLDKGRVQHAGSGSSPAPFDVFFNLL